MTREFLADTGYSIDYVNSFSYADSIADLHMLEMVGNPTAVYADENLKRLAAARGWSVYPPDNGTST
jgi:phosphoserine phosphatase